MAKKDDRVKRLIDILRIRGFVSIKELSILLDVSEMTVRRDLKLLENKNVASNVNGTSVYNPAHLGFANDYNLSDETEKQNSQKEAIGMFAASLVKKGDVIIVDTGTTTERIIPYLPQNLDLTVLTYATNILMELRRLSDINMIFAGGYYQPNTQIFISDEGLSLIKSIRAQKVFVSAAGIHKQLGVTCANAYEVPVKKLILNTSLQKILVADSKKFGSVRSSYFCELSDIDIVITDKELPEEWIQILKSKDIEFHLV